MCLACFCVARGIVTRDGYGSEDGRVEWVAGEDEASSGGEEGSDVAALGRAASTADWAAALEGWGSPGSSLVDVGEAAVD